MKPTAATTIVATGLAPTGSPAAFRMAGLTTMMYAMATNVDVPPRMSFRMVETLSCARRLRRVLLRQNPRQRRDGRRVLRQFFRVDFVERVGVGVVVVEIVQRLGDEAEARNAGLRQRIDIRADFFGDFEAIGGEGGERSR